MILCDAKPRLNPPQIPQFADPQSTHLVTLRRKYKLEQVAGTGDDFARARRIKSWVRRQWNHGFDRPAHPKTALELLELAQHGMRFSCGRYAQVFVECCLSLGIPARAVSIYRRDHDFPWDCPGNSGHSVSEAYCRRWKKWVLLDANVNCHYTRDGIPCGVLDLHEAWHRNQGKDVHQILDKPIFIEEINCPEISPEQMRRNWDDFHRHRTLDFYYYIRVGWHHGFQSPPPDASPSLMYAGLVHPPLAHLFAQASWLSRALVTGRREDFDWATDHTYLRATMLGKGPSRRVEITLDHDMPFFSHFDLSLNRQPFRRVRGSSVKISLQDDQTTIRVRAVDTTGRPGHEARAEFAVRCDDRSSNA